MVRDSRCRMMTRGRRSRMPAVGVLQMRGVTMKMAADVTLNRRCVSATLFLSAGRGRDSLTTGRMDIRRRNDEMSGESRLRRSLHRPPSLFNLNSIRRMSYCVFVESNSHVRGIWWRKEVAKAFIGRRFPICDTLSFG